MSAKGSSWASDGPAGSTPLDSSDLDGLKLSWVATQDDLNGAEQANIVRALGQRKWTSMPVNRVLDDLTLRQLHRAMFSEVWRWAGRYRTTERNIGIAPEHVAVAVRDLTADTLMWLSGTNPRPFDEVGALFHHRLVAIHPFPNGNGRHARAATDLLLRSLDQAAFTWGSTSLNEASDTRARYISALQRADRGRPWRFARLRPSVTSSSRCYRAQRVARRAWIAGMCDSLSGFITVLRMMRAVAASCSTSCPRLARSGPLTV